MGKCAVVMQCEALIRTLLCLSEFQARALAVHYFCILFSFSSQRARFCTIFSFLELLEKGLSYSYSCHGPFK